MKLSVRSGLLLSAAAVLLPACDGTQPLSVGEVPQSRAIAAHAERVGSWMRPAATRSELVYASYNFGTTVDVFSFPKGALVGQLTGFDNPTGLCSDVSGNVWITNGSPPEVIEYRHGGTAPIATLAAESPFACSVDPSTGNLAVTNSNGNISIYRSASGIPTDYSNLGFPSWWYCAYDNHGNLFAGSPDTSNLAELPAGRNTINTLVVNRAFAPGSMQWYKGHLAVANAGGSAQSRAVIYHVSISGSKATVSGSTTLSSAGHHREGLAVQYWAVGHTVVGPDKLYFNFWRYPRGGTPLRLFVTSTNSCGASR